MCRSCFLIPTILAKHEKEDWIDGERTEDVVAFLDRLYTAKRKVEQRIVMLGGEDEFSVRYKFAKLVFLAKFLCSNRQLPIKRVRNRA